MVRRTGDYLEVEVYVLFRLLRFDFFCIVLYLSLVFASIFVLDYHSEYLDI